MAADQAPNLPLGRHPGCACAARTDEDVLFPSQPTRHSACFLQKFLRLEWGGRMAELARSPMLPEASLPAPELTRSRKLMVACSCSGGIQRSPLILGSRAASTARQLSGSSSAINKRFAMGKSSFAVISRKKSRLLATGRRCRAKRRWKRHFRIGVESSRRCCQENELSCRPFVQSLQEKLISTSRNTDERFSRNEFVSRELGRIERTLFTCSPVHA